jgi:hypothetical protein
LAILYNFVVWDISYENLQVHTCGVGCHPLVQQCVFTGEMESGKVYQARQGKQSADKAAGDSFGAVGK